MRSRFWSSVSGMKFSVFRSKLFTRGAPLDALFVLWPLENGIHKNARRMHLIGVELAEFDQFFHFSDDVIGSCCHHGIEVARGLAIDEVAPAVAFPPLDERKVTAQAALHHVPAPIEFAGFFSFRDHRAVARGCVERGNAGASGAQALAQRSLRIQFHLQFTAKDELLEEFVFPDVSRNHLLDLALLQQHANAEIVDSRVVADDGEILRAFPANGGDQVLWNAAESEAAHKNRCAIADFFNSHVSRGDAFVHSVLRSVRGSLLHPVQESEGGHGSDDELLQRALAGAMLGVFEQTVESSAIEVFSLVPHGLNLRGIVNVNEGIGRKKNQAGALARSDNAKFFSAP